MNPTTPEKTQAQDEQDVLAENARLTTELQAAISTIADRDKSLAELTTELTTTKAALEKANTDFAEQLKTLTELQAKDMDANKRAAAMVAKLGIRDTAAAKAKEDEAGLTATELCMKAHGTEFTKGERHFVTV